MRDRGHARAGAIARMPALEVEVEKKRTPPNPPKGGNARNRDLYEGKLAAFTAEHFPGVDVGYIAHYAAMLRMRKTEPTVEALRPLLEERRAVVSPQWQDALDQANRVKVERSRLRAMVRAPQNYIESRRVVARLLITPQPALHRLRALELLCWIWGMYEKKAKRMLDVAEASEFVIVGRLTGPAACPARAAVAGWR